MPPGESRIAQGKFVADPMRVTISMKPSSEASETYTPPASPVHSPFGERYPEMGKAAERLRGKAGENASHRRSRSLQKFHRPGVSRKAYGRIAAIFP
jgi:hypothetical protein